MFWLIRYLLSIFTSLCGQIHNWFLQLCHRDIKNCTIFDRYTSFQISFLSVNYIYIKITFILAKVLNYYDIIAYFYLPDLLDSEGFESNYFTMMCLNKELALATTVQILLGRSASCNTADSIPDFTHDPSFLSVCTLGDTPWCLNLLACCNPWMAQTEFLPLAMAWPSLGCCRLLISRWEISSVSLRLIFATTYFH